MKEEDEEKRTRQRRGIRIKANNKQNKSCGEKQDEEKEDEKEEEEGEETEEGVEGELKVKGWVEEEERRKEKMNDKEADV